MKADAIFSLPPDRRMAAFIERWRELDEFTGNRTGSERREMAQIADAIMGHMIRDHEQVEELKEKLRKSRLAKRLWKKYAKGVYQGVRRNLPIIDAVQQIVNGVRSFVDATADGERGARNMSRPEGFDNG